MEKITKVEWVFARSLNQANKGKTILFIGPTEERCLELKNMVNFKSVADIVYAGFSKKEIKQLLEKFQKTDQFIKMTSYPEGFLKTEFYFLLENKERKPK